MHNHIIELGTNITIKCDAFIWKPKNTEGYKCVQLQTKHKKGKIKENKSK